MVASLLHVVANEDLTFFLLAQLLNKVGLKNLYVDEFKGLKVLCF